MITIHGPTDIPEYRLAERLRAMIIATWPGIVTAQWDTVTIIAGVKCYGQKVVDIDLVVFVHLAEWRDYPAPSVNPHQRPLYVQSLCLTIELKGHQPDSISFEGTDVYVDYHDRRHCVSSQSFDQQVALRGYLEANRIAPPYVVNLIWLYNTPERFLPSAIHNILGSDATWETFLQRVQHNKSPWEDYRERVWLLQAVWRHRDEQYLFQARDLLTRRLEPSPLDRAKIETITQRVLADQQYADKMGQQLLIFRGRGGTGKTVRLLQLANQLYQERGDRVLILSYNTALVADLRRLLHMMHITEAVAERSISIRTVHSFMGILLRELGVVAQDEPDFYDTYDRFKAQALALLEDTQPDDLEDILLARPEVFDWDYVLIDEAQDWPPDERDILYHLYGHRRFVLADGMDQFVRGSQKTNWRVRVPRRESQIVTLQKSLRLKAGLATFVQTFAQQLGLHEWQVEPNTDVYGGRILILVGNYNQALHADLLEHHLQQGNHPIDMLFCLPPDMVGMHGQHADRSDLGTRLVQWGYQVWDGTAQTTRQSYPLKLDEFRIVQYDSCRGLEGWTVVNLGFDQLYDYKQRSYLPPEQPEMFFDAAAEAQMHAARWLMIPLTRAIDTLVIQVASAEHPVARALQTAAAACQDSVTLEWRTI